MDRQCKHAIKEIKNATELSRTVRSSTKCCCIELDGMHPADVFKLAAENYAQEIVEAIDPPVSLEPTLCREPWTVNELAGFQ